MAARSKVVKAKWGVSSGEPEDLPDFLSNDEIVQKMNDQPPRGVFRLQLKGRPTVAKNKNGDDMIKMILEVNDPAKDKKGYNGFALWENQNVTDQSKPFLLKWLKSLGVTWRDFNINTKKTNNPGDLIPDEILSIGNVTFGGQKKVYLLAALGRKPAHGDYEEGTEVKRWVPKEDAQADEPDDEEEEDESAEDTESEEDELREELDGLSPAVLRKRVKENDEDAKTTGLKKPDLIDLIVEQELGEEDEEEDEDESDDAEEELREELSDLSLAQLKKRAKDNGRKIAEVRKAGEDDLIEMIVEDELDESEEDDNEPPF